ncbi:hypothetical protein WI89_08120 [Burkholderia ubonensis]|uniref:DUF2827 family protein n=1 Tax=Burkholderia ubonensis TaxID=101571 RepID=UPI00075F4A27|nr:DUF2827 family protein [Burkholderia ubonensis]KVD75511.1 hypothetical protein WI89_08120 [Burkholderia ubonensis]
MRIGIAVTRTPGQTLWAHVAGRYALCLAMAFECLPFVRSVTLVDGATELPSGDAGIGAWRILPMCEAGDAIDVVIETGSVLDSGWLALMRARGKKVVYLCSRPPYVALGEAVLFNRASRLGPTTPCDEVWYWPQHEAHASQLRLMYRCDAYEVPYLWHPRFMEARIWQVAHAGAHFGYEAGTSDYGWRVAIFESNTSVSGAANMPMLVCDEAFRACPECLQGMHVLNAEHLQAHPSLLYLANALELVRHERAAFHGRHDAVDFLARHAHAVVTHQWPGGPSEWALDVLYGDYPLIHDMSWLKEAGYYYPAFDLEAGAAQLVRAFHEHDNGLMAYRARSQKAFVSVDPAAPHNLSRYAARLRKLAVHLTTFDGARLA